MVISGRSPPATSAWNLPKAQSENGARMRLSLTLRALLNCCHSEFCSSGISGLDVSPAMVTSPPSPGGLDTDCAGVFGYAMKPSGITSVPGRSGAGPLGGTYVGNCTRPGAAGFPVAPGAGAVVPAADGFAAGAAGVQAASTPSVATAAQPPRTTNARRVIPARRARAAPARSLSTRRRYCATGEVSIEVAAAAAAYI